MMYQWAQRLSVVVLLFCCCTGIAWASAAEQMLEYKIRQQLEAVVGPGKVKVTVTGTQRAPQQIRQRTYANPQVGARRTRSARDNQGNQRQNQQESYVFDSTETLISTPGDGLAQRSVSVVYEARSDPEQPGPSEAMIREMVAASMGFNPERGDRLSVRATHFDTRWQKQLEAAMAKANQKPALWWGLGLALGGVVLGLGGGFYWARRRQKRDQQTYSEPLYWQPPGAVAVPAEQPQAVD